MLEFVNMSLPKTGCRSGVSAAFEEAGRQIFFPRSTVRCIGVAAFRTQLARDLGCLLDVDDSVLSWSCLSLELTTATGSHVPDFTVVYEDGQKILADAAVADGNPAAAEAAERAGAAYRTFRRRDIEGIRLENARDLLRYARYRTPLNDRLRILTALGELGSIPIAECLHLFREAPPMTGLAWLILHRFISVDLDEAMIGPDTIVRRYQR